MSSYTEPLPPLGQRIRLTEAHYEHMRLGKYREAHPRDVPQKHVEEIKAYLRELPDMVQKGFGYYWYGVYGVGKSYIAALMMKQLAMRGYACLHIQAASVTNTVIKDIPFNDSISMWERMQRVNCLFIDDLGAEPSGNDFHSAKLIEIVRIRAQLKNAATFITSNIPFDPTIPRSTLSKRYGKPFQDLLCDVCVPIHVEAAESRRFANHAAVSRKLGFTYAQGKNKILNQSS